VLFRQYAATSDGESYRDFEAIAEAQKADAARVDLALAAAGCASISADRRGRRIDEKTARVLMDVFPRGGNHARTGILFLLQAPRTPRATKRVLGAWLLAEFPKFENRRLRGHVGAALLDLVCAEHGPRLTALVLDQRLGASRGALCLPLAMAKEPSAPSALASLLDGDLCPSALHGLARLGPKAAAHAGAVEPLLRHGDPAVRRLARKVLARMGVRGEPPSAGAHLVKGRNAGPPPGLSEWSTNLDACELEEALGVLGSAVDGGFGQGEISEVVAAADNREVDQARKFRFPIRLGEAAYDLWLGISMDDEEAPDLYLESAPEVVKRIDTAWRASRFGKDVPA
jgi:hypothetical protein